MNLLATQTQKRAWDNDVSSLQIYSNFKETETIPELIIGGLNLNIWGADDTVSMADSEKKLQDLLKRMVEESKKKR